MLLRHAKAHKINPTEDHAQALELLAMNGYTRDAAARLLLKAMTLTSTKVYSLVRSFIMLEKSGNRAGPRPNYWAREYPSDTATASIVDEYIRNLMRGNGF